MYLIHSFKALTKVLVKLNSLFGERQGLWKEVMSVITQTDAAGKRALLPVWNKSSNIQGSMSSKAEMYFQHVWDCDKLSIQTSR